MVYGGLFTIGKAAYEKLMKDRKAESPTTQSLMRISAECPDGGQQCGDICIDNGETCSGGSDN